MVRISDGSSGRALSTIKRRLSTLSVFYAYLIASDRPGAQPGAAGRATRASNRRGRRGVPLVRSARLLPQILEPTEVSALLGALRRCQDPAMVEAMLVGDLRRGELLGLRLETCAPASAGCSWPKATAGTSVWCPFSSRIFASVAALGAGRSAAGHSGHDRQSLTVGDCGIEPAEESNLLIAEE